MALESSENCGRGSNICLLLRFFLIFWPGRRKTIKNLRHVSWYIALIKMPFEYYTLYRSISKACGWQGFDPPRLHRAQPSLVSVGSGDNFPGGQAARDYTYTERISWRCSDISLLSFQSWSEYEITIITHSLPLVHPVEGPWTSKMGMSYIRPYSFSNTNKQHLITRHKIPVSSTERSGHLPNSLLRLREISGSNLGRLSRLSTPANFLSFSR